MKIKYLKGRKLLKIELTIYMTVILIINFKGQKNEFKITKKNIIFI